MRTLPNLRSPDGRSVPAGQEQARRQRLPRLPRSRLGLRLAAVRQPAIDIDSKDILGRAPVGASEVEVKHVLIGWRELDDKTYHGHIDPRAKKRTNAEAAKLAHGHRRTSSSANPRSDRRDRQGDLGGSGLAHRRPVHRRQGHAVRPRVQEPRAAPQAERGRHRQDRVRLPRDDARPAAAARSARVQGHPRSPRRGRSGLGPARPDRLEGRADGEARRRSAREGSHEGSTPTSSRPTSSRRPRPRAPTSRS